MNPRYAGTYDNQATKHWRSSNQVLNTMYPGTSKHMHMKKQKAKRHKTATGVRLCTWLAKAPAVNQLGMASNCKEPRALPGFKSDACQLRVEPIGGTK